MNHWKNLRKFWLKFVALLVQLTSDRPQTHFIFRFFRFLDKLRGKLKISKNKKKSWRKKWDFVVVEVQVAILWLNVILMRWSSVFIAQCCTRLSFTGQQVGLEDFPDSFSIFSNVIHWGRSRNHWFLDERALYSSKFIGILIWLGDV